jgi:hypothetical protein
MNRPGIIAVIVGGLTLDSANLQGESTIAGPADGPYAPIIARNVFALNPPLPASSNQRDSRALPNITLAGITTICGPAEALYQVAGGSRDGKRGQDESYILKEGQEQDEVAVVTINVSEATVTFINHGVRQDITLANARSGGGKQFVAEGVTSPFGVRNPKPGDDNYADQRSVTAPLSPKVNPGAVMNGDEAAGEAAPPGHGNQ